MLDAGLNVVGLDNLDDFYDPQIKRNNLRRALDTTAYRFFEGDIRNRRDLDALPEVDAVVHLAARAGVRPSIDRPSLYADVNVVGTSRILEWARDRRMRRVVFASSSSVYGNRERGPFREDEAVGDPVSPYAATKRAGELLVRTCAEAYGLRAAALRFFTVFGPRQRPEMAIHKFARLMRAGDLIPVYGDGTTSRDYTFIDDTIGGVLGALNWVSREGGGYEVFNLGSREPVSLAELVSTLAEEMNVEARIHRLPLQPGDVRTTFADTTRASSQLGYAPQTDFRSGIQAFLRWFDAGTGS